MSSHIQTGISQREVLAALKKGQNENVVFLGPRTATRKIAEALMALANGQGGLIIAGVSPNGEIGSLREAEAICDRISQATVMTDPPLIMPMPQVIDVDGKQVCAALVPVGLPHVYSVRGQYLVRDGRNIRPLLSQELRRLLLDRSEAGFESQVLHNAGLADLDADRIIDDYRDLLGSGAGSDAVSLLFSRGCLARTVDDPQVTVAGMLLFGKEPQRWVRSAEITCVRYPGNVMSDDFVREDVRGVLANQIRRAEAFVYSNMRTGVRIRGLHREDTPEYPISIVREAIVNAVAHRDYSIRGDGIRIFMFNDRLEVYSPGRLPGHVTIDNIVNERYSRNEAIVQVLSEMGFIERLGYGIDRMLAVCDDEGLQPPEFVETAAGFKVTIHGHGPQLVAAALPMSMYAHLQLNPRQEELLDFLQANRRITNRDYQLLCPDASPETLRRDFADLVDQGVLLKIGEKRATYYVLK